jgi:hypothetical protein
MPVGYLTSSTLISTVKREGMIPTNQSTFTDADFLAIANQEIRIGLLPSIMQYHEEYLARTSAPTPVVQNQNNYPIPYRAVGGKLREVFYLDTNNQLRSMTRINPDDRPYYQQTNFQNRFIYFYFEGNEVVLVPDVGTNPTGSVLFTYYMRPNELVDESRVSTITNISTTNTSGVISNIASGTPTIITSVGHGLSSNNIIRVTGSNCNPIIDGFWPITVIDSDTFSIETTTINAGTQGNWSFSTTTYTVDQIPQNVTPFLQGGTTITGFSSSAKLDILQRNPGHKTIAFDISPLSVDVTNKQITFYTGDVLSYSIPPNIGTAPIPGDYIAFAGECIIPQIPADLHDVLCQRVLMRCLSALGDAQGVQIAAAKLAEMEKNTGNLIDNRSEGQAQKINNLRGLLRSAKIRKRGWQ